MNHQSERQFVVESASYRSACLLMLIIVIFTIRNFYHGHIGAVGFCFEEFS